jgi:phospholipid-translocating ATPase
MLLRGCKLKNTDWVVGLIIYTGEETAIMMNGSRPFTKISNI